MEALLVKTDVLITAASVAAAVLVLWLLRKRIAAWIEEMRQSFAPQGTEEMDHALGADRTAAADGIFLLQLAAWREEHMAQDPGAGTGAGTSGRDGKIRVRITFWGRVQGVGFRYQAQHAAIAMDLTGWVENTEEGSVVLEAQGREEDIARMMTHLRQARWIRILSTEVEQLPLRENERSFRVLGY
jgi:acylphosphatase